ncbi:MAG: sulfatase-like hydrolase/transferase [Armatimonadota bacterium]|nr:sulfatase-like hydrolase/transferase [Armatimonadota bacterium]
MTRPHILWISLEDTSPRFGCYGDTLARTPHIDALAASGCRFPHAFATTGVCAPSRAAIITGMYSTAIGTHHMRTTHPQQPTRFPPYSAVVPHYVRCFTEYLRAAGYYCTNNEKTDYQFAPPFTAWDECSRQAHWRNRRDPQQPFFAVFNPTVTHESGMWPKENERLQTDPDAVELPPYLPATPVTRRTLARHYDNLARADEFVGEILAQLEADGLAQNTIVFLWSDHGEGLPRGKRWPYDRGLRVPLIVRWPGHITAGSVCDDLVSLIDLGPTVLSLTGVANALHLQGRPFLGPQKTTPREYIFATRDRHDEAYDMVRAVRDRRYKYIRHFRPDLPYLLWIPYRNRHPIMQEMWRLHLAGELSGAQTLMFAPRPPEELYDLENDPWEINNLAGDARYAAELARLRAVLEGWRAEVGDMGEISEEHMVHAWWPGGVQPQTAAPLLIPITSDHYGQEPAGDFYDCHSPALVQLHCGTQGASIGYTTETGEKARWQLYTEPFRLPLGVTTVRARAIRIGYAESIEARATFTVRETP